MKTKMKGFTLVELVIVIAIVIILSVVSVPIYTGYTRSAKMAEGYALLGTILSAQKAYYSQYGMFLLQQHPTSGESKRWISEDIVLQIDARGNKYFTLFGSGYKGEDVNSIKYKFVALVVKPEELRVSQEHSGLALFYDVTSGSTFKDNINSI